MEHTEGALTQDAVASPYIVTSPVPVDGPFVGRDAVLQSLFLHLSALEFQLILLQGARKQGKTSLLLQLASRLPDRFLPVYFDLYGRASQPMPFLQRDLFQAILTAAGLELPASRRLQDVSRAAQLVQAALFRAGATRRVVLLFDEFDVPADALGPDAGGVRFFPWLEQLLSRAEQAGVILAHGRVRSLLTPFESQPFFKRAPRVTLFPLSEEEAQGLLIDPAAGALNLDADALRLALELTGRHPWLLQLLGAELLDLFPAGQPVNGETLRRQLPRLLEVAQDGLSWIWDGLTSEEQRVALALHLLPPLTRPIDLQRLHELMVVKGLSLSSSALDNALLTLESAGLVQRDGECLRPACGLFRRWLQALHPEYVLTEPVAQLEALLGAPTLPPLPEAPPPVAGPSRDDPGLEALWCAAEATPAPSTPGDPRTPGLSRPRGNRLAPLSPPPIRLEVDHAMSGLEQITDGQSIPTSTEGMAQAGLQALQRNFFQDAETLLRQVLQAEPGRVDALLGLSKALAGNGMLDDAVRLLDDARDHVEACAIQQAELYLAWLDSLEGSPEAWLALLEEALAAYPGHEGLNSRLEQANLNRVRRLLSEGRAVEAAAALGALGELPGELLAPLQQALLAALEQQVRTGHPDARALFTLVRQLLPDPEPAWQIYLGILVEEGEKAEFSYLERARDLYETARVALETAGVQARHAPKALQSRLRAGLAHLQTLQERQDEAELAQLLNQGRLEQAEAWLEELLVRRRSPHLETRLRDVRTRRQLGARYQTVEDCRRSKKYDEAQLQLAAILTEAPNFETPDGRPALMALDELSRLKAGAPPTRTAPWLPVGTFLAGGLLALTGMTVLGQLNLNGPRASFDQALRPVTSATVKLASALPITRTSAVPERVQAVVAVPAPAKASPPPGVAASSLPVSVPAAPAASVPSKAAPASAVPVPVAPATTAPAQVAPAAGERNAVLVAQKPPSSLQTQPPTPVAAATALPPRGTATITTQPVAIQSRQPATSAAATVTSPPVVVSSLPAVQKPRAPQAARLKRTAQGWQVAPPAPQAQAAPASTSTAAANGVAALPTQAGGARVVTAPLVVNSTPQPESTEVAAVPVDPVRAGILALRAGDTEGAMGAFRRAIALDPSRADAWLELGDLYQREGRSLEAQRALQRAVKLDESLARGWLSLGRLQQTRGFKDDALESFQHVVRLDGGGSMGKEAASRMERLKQAPAPAGGSWDQLGQGPVKLFADDGTSSQK